MASDLARALAALGHEVEVITTCGRSELHGDRWWLGHWGGLRVWRVAPRNLYWRFDKDAARPGRLARMAWHAVDLWNPSVFGPVGQILARMRPEVINTHNIDGFSPAVWQIANKYARAVVHTLHDYHLVCPRATMRHASGAACERLCRVCSLYASYHRWFAGNVRALVAPSKSIAELHRQAGWRGPHIEIVRNGVDIPPLCPPQTPPAGPLRVIFLARLEREKGCETLLAALPNCPGVEFHVAGRGPYEERFRAAKVHWHGFVAGSEKHDLLSRADVFLQLSECRDNAPLGLIEARRYGLFPVATRIGGIPELVDGTGVLIPPASPQALAETLAGLARRASAIRAGREDRARNAAAYGTREMALEYVRVFHSALQ